MGDETRVVHGLTRAAMATGALLSIALAGCGSSPAPAAPAAPVVDETDEEATVATVAEVPAPAPAKPPHWTYEGERGPERWGHLDEKFEACEAGKQQSPIDIGAARKGGGHKALAIAYKKATDTVIVNNGHTIQVNYQSGSFLTFDGKQYELVQFHVHAPSEHRIDGAAAAAELHLVHRSSEGELAVVGVLLRQGKDSRFLEQFWAELPKSEGEHPLTSRLDVARALPKNRRYYTYAGSLTTPPCTEGVRWIVMKKPMTISKAQLARFESLVGKNARPPQPLNARVVHRF